MLSIVSLASLLHLITSSLAQDVTWNYPTSYNTFWLVVNWNDVLVADWTSEVTDAALWLWAPWEDSGLNEVYAWIEAVPVSSSGSYQITFADLKYSAPEQMPFLAHFMLNDTNSDVFTVTSFEAAPTTYRLGATVLPSTAIVTQTSVVTSVAVVSTNTLSGPTATGVPSSSGAGALTTSPPSASSDPSPSSHDNGVQISTGAIAGIAIGGAVVLGLIVGLFFWLSSRSKHRYSAPTWVDQDANTEQVYHGTDGPKSMGSMNGYRSSFHPQDVPDTPQIHELDR